MNEQEFKVFVNKSLRDMEDMDPEYRRRAIVHFTTKYCQKCGWDIYNEGCMCARRINGDKPKFVQYKLDI